MQEKLLALNLNLRIDENFILKLHSILMNGDHPDAGFYRRHGVRIVGPHVVTANYMKIPSISRWQWPYRTASHACNASA